MPVLIITYIGFHLLIYVVWLRRQKAFRREKVIFLYHCIPAAIILLALFGLLGVSGSAESLAFAVFGVSLHGIYSLSFLELWALSQGGYSIGILMRIDAAAVKGIEADMKIFEEIGETKRKGRLAGLMRLKLIEMNKDSYSLAARGSFVAAILSMAAWLTNLKETE